MWNSRLTQMQTQRKFEEPIISQSTLALIKNAKAQVIKLEGIYEEDFFKGSCAVINTSPRRLEFGERMSPFLGSLMCVLSVRVSDPQECRGGSWAGWGLWAQKRLRGRPAHPEYVKAKTVWVSLGPDGKDGKCQPFLKSANLKKQRIPVQEAIWIVNMDTFELLG